MGQAGAIYRTARRLTHSFLLSINTPWAEKAIAEMATLPISNSTAITPYARARLNHATLAHDEARELAASAEAARGVRSV
jgi:hypothetical protein